MYDYSFGANFPQSPPLRKRLSVVMITGHVGDILIGKMMSNVMIFVDWVRVRKNFQCDLYVAELFAYVDIT